MCIYCLQAGTEDGCVVLFTVTQAGLQYDRPLDKTDGNKHVLIIDLDVLKYCFLYPLSRQITVIKFRHFVLVLQIHVAISPEGYPIKYITGGHSPKMSEK